MPTLESRIYHWNRRQPEPAFVQKWRTPGRTRGLVISYFSLLAVALVAEVVSLFWMPALALFVIALMGAMVSWTILRNTINMKDAAPREELDGYEQSVLDRWRSTALRLLSILLFVGALGSIFIGVTFDDAISTASFSCVIGLYMIFSYLAVTTLPAIGYALTFNRPAED